MGLFSIFSKRVLLAEARDASDAPIRPRLRRAERQRRAKLALSGSRAAGTRGVVNSRTTPLPALLSGIQVEGTALCPTLFPTAGPAPPLPLQEQGEGVHLRCGHDQSSPSRIRPHV